MAKPTVVLLAAMMIGLNLIIALIVKTAALPIYLDSAGIILTGIIAGPWVAAAVGIGTCALGAIVFLPFLVFYTGTAIVIGLLSGFLARKGFFKRWLTVIPAALIIAICAAIVSAPVTARVFGGVTTAGSDAITLFFKSTGDSLMTSVFKSGLTSEPVDKLLASSLAMLIGQSLSRRTLQWFPGAAERLGRGSTAETKI
jgi:energy-coupling factor transport system substrate-specific component